MVMKASSFRLLMLAGVLCFSGTLNHALAQVDSGRIIGQVLDSKNASIAGATITVVDERTNVERTTTSNADGSYQIVALRPSFYAIEVTADQFAPAEQKAVQLTVGQEIHRNFIMQLASVSASISVVESIESAIDTSSARLGVNINQREVNALPLNGRQVSQLFLEAPGAINSGSGTFNDIRFSGRAVEQNAVRYDGIEGGGVIDSQPGVLNAEIATPFRLQSSLENVQEFRVESNNYPAEYGTGTGGQISVITKSGSNSFHGSAYEYFRNDKLDAHNFFDRANKPSELRLNQFGASLGGPIAKDKLFFYAYYEGYRLRSGINYREAVPSAAVRGLPACGSPGAPPFTTTAPYGCVDPNIQPLLAGFVDPRAVLVDPSKGGSSDPARIDIMQLNGLTQLQENSGGLRLDYHINNSNTLYARYFRDQGNWNYPEGVTGRSVAVVDNPQNGVLSLQTNFGSNLINEAKVGFNESLSQIRGIAPTVGTVDFSAISINFSGAVTNGQGTNTGAANPGGLIRASSAANGRSQPYTPYSISFIDNVSWMAGNHNVKFGAEVRLVRIYADRLGGTTYTFANVDSLVANTLTSTAFLGDLSTPSPYNNGATGNRLLKQEMYIGYVQDEVKLRPNLTLNYGMRLEYYAPMREDRNLSAYLDINSGAFSCAGPAPLCTSPTKSNWYKSDASFGPRVGIAWQPFYGRSGIFGGERSVFRAGFGIFSGPGQAEDTIQPTVDSDRVSSTVSGGSYCGTLLSCKSSPAAITANFSGNPLNRSAQPRAYAPEYTVPERVYQYSASWQQQWGSKFVSTVAYVGSQGRNLFLRNVANRIVSVRDNTDLTKNAVVVRQFSIDCGGTTPTPAVCPGVGTNPGTTNPNTVLNPFAEVDFKTSGGHDAYNALQTQLVRRSNSGLTLAAQYTYSKSFGNSTGSNEARTVGNPFDYNYDEGYNLFDVRHAANVSALYDLPVGRNKHYLSSANAIVEGVLGNWQVGTIVSARSGLPVEIYVTRPDILYEDSSGKFFGSPQCPGFAKCSDPGAIASTHVVINTPGGGSSRAFRRPDVVPGVNPILPNGYVNPAAFAVPLPGTYGNLQRGSVHGPGDWQADLTVQKRFPIRETMNVEFRAEVYNLLNHPNFANPPGTIAPSFSTTVQPGQPLTSTTAGNGGAFGKFNQTLSTSVGTGANRQIQLALRLNF
jgi:hypothetical protein